MRPSKMRNAYGRFCFGCVSGISGAECLNLDGLSELPEDRDRVSWVNPVGVVRNGR